VQHEQRQLLLGKFRQLPLRRGLNATGVAKYSEVKHVEGYILETLQDTASGMEIISVESNSTTLDPLG